MSIAKIASVGQNIVSSNSPLKIIKGGNNVVSIDNFDNGGEKISMDGVNWEKLISEIVLFKFGDKEVGKKPNAKEHDNEKD